MLLNPMVAKSPKQRTPVNLAELQDLLVFEVKLQIHQ